MADLQFSIQKQSLPTRCEICHQADQFDPVTNTCQRCAGVTAKGEIRLDQSLSWFQRLVIRTHLGADVPFPQIRKSRFRKIGDIVLALGSVLFLAAFSFFIVSNYLHDARRQNHQTSIMQLRCINAALIDFQMGKGNGQFTNRLSEFEEFTYCQVDTNAQHVPSNGYLLGPLIIQPADNEHEAKYSITAFPAVKTGIFRTGDLSFFLDETGVIRFSRSPTELADVNSDPIN